MPGTIIEVVLGLVFVYFIFSMLCSGINEFISRTLGKRADFLTAGLWSMLDNSPPVKEGEKASNEDLERARVHFEAFQTHPLVRQLGQVVSETSEAKGWRKASRWLCGGVRRAFTRKTLRDAVAPVPGGTRQFEDGRHRPPYIPPTIFASVVNTFIRADNDLPDVASSAQRRLDWKEATTERPEPVSGSPLERSLQALVAEAGDDAKRLRANLEGWYDAQMERVSGWYKSESKRVLLLLAVVVVVFMNVDTISITRTLWTDPTARVTLADAAQRQIDAAARATTTLTTTTTVAVAPGAAAPPAAPPTTEAKPALVLSCPGTDTTTTDTGVSPTTAVAPASSAQVVSNALNCAESLPIPIGWHLPKSHFWNSVWTGFTDALPGGVFLKLLGWGLTVGALTFGAPFWFDLLNRMGSLRASGPKPKASDETPN